MKKILISLAVVLLAFFFRFNNLNWDVNLHLHPDERFLTMVGTAMKIPASFGQYLDQSTSLMNPTNIGFKFFVYGRFPLIMTKYLAVIYNMDNYNDLTILGRQLSAFFDLLIVVLVIKTVLLFEKRYKFSPALKYWAGFFYAIAVLPIQLSHFFAVDTFLNFFMFGSFYFAFRHSMVSEKNKTLRDIILSAIFFGLALSCKVTALFILPLNLFFISKTIFKNKISFKIFNSLFIFFTIYLLTSYFTVRFADPYYFQNKNIFDPNISKLFIENITSLKNMTVKNLNNWFPPMVQWLNENTVKHSLVNNIIFGLGMPLATLVLVGMGLVISKIYVKNQKAKTNNKAEQQFNNFDLIIILFWVLGFFVYQSIQATPALRYFIFIYPFFSIFAAMGMNYLLDYNLKINGKKLIYPKIYSYIFILISVLILLLWPVMFSSIYTNKNSRVEASEWIYKNLPSGSLVLGELWDDSLPLGVNNDNGKQFVSDQLPVFDPDTPEKWKKMNAMLETADYYVLSSNRGWGSIQTVPEKYPIMSRFYKELLSNRNFKYKKIKEFTSFPQLKINSWKLTINDSWSEEIFTVYDHPTVLIYKNVKNNNGIY